MKLFEKEELKILWPFYISNIITYSLAIVPLIFFSYFYLKGFEAGLGGWLLALSLLGGFIFEIPTGVFADIYGRKKSVLIYYFSAAVIFFFVPFVKSISLLLIMFFLSGISTTFRSGAKEALVVDYLHKRKKKKLIQTYFTKTHMILSASILLAGLFLTFILYFFGSDRNYFLFGLNFTGIDIVWIIEALGLFLGGAIILIFVDEEFSRKKSSIKENFNKSFNIFKEAIKFCKHQNNILLLMAAIFITTTFVNIWFVSYQPFLLENKVDVKNFGILESLAAGFGILLPLLAQRIAKRIGKNIFLAFINIIRLFLGIIIFIFLGPVFAIVYYFLIRSVHYLEAPVESSFFQENIPSRQRATLGSILSLVYSLAGFLGLFLAGLALNNFSPAFSIFLSAFLLIPAIIALVKIKRR